MVELVVVQIKKLFAVYKKRQKRVSVFRPGAIFFKKLLFLFSFSYVYAYIAIK
jgi:hypothetical protein